MQVDRVSQTSDRARITFPALQRAVLADQNENEERVYNEQRRVRQFGAPDIESHKTKDSDIIYREE
jgi:hypothetical protein